MGLIIGVRFVPPSDLISCVSGVLGDPFGRRQSNRGTFTSYLCVSWFVGSIVARTLQALAAYTAGEASLSEVQAVVRGQTTGCLSSQCAEDMFNHSKNSFLVKGKKRFRRPEKAMAAVLARRVPERVHRFVPIEPSEPVAKTAALSHDAFEASQQACSLAVSSLSGPSQTPAWYSSGPEQVSRIHADIELFRAASLTKRYRSVVENCWLGQLVDWTHQIALRRVGASDDEWFVGLHHWSDSSVLVWPCRRRAFLLNSEEHFFELLCDGVREPTLVAFYELAEWHAATFEYRSPAWQMKHLHQSACTMPSAIRRVEVLAPTTVLEVAARSGWWKLGKIFLTNLAKHISCELPPAASLFDTAACLTAHVLECDRHDALVHLRRRLAIDETSTSFCHELLEVEDVGQVLTREDEDSFKKTKKSAQTTLTDVKAFRCEFYAAAAAETTKRASQAAKVRRKTGSAPAAVWRLPLLSEVSQTEAAGFCPPGASIWRDRVDGAWCSHFPPFPRLSRSWRKHGECEALRMCLSDVWQKHCMVSGIALSDCPLKGLLDGEPALQPNSRSAASSSAAGPGTSARSRRRQ